jgi:hypothetical protein
MLIDEPLVLAQGNRDIVECSKRHQTGWRHEVIRREKSFMIDKCKWGFVLSSACFEDTASNKDGE